MAEQYNLPVFVGGESEKKSEKKSRARDPRRRNNTARAQGDMRKYIEEGLKGALPGTDLADLTTFTPKEITAARRWARQEGFKAYGITVTELCFAFKAWKWAELFGLSRKDTLGLLVKLKEDLVELTETKLAPPPPAEDRDQLQGVMVDQDVINETQGNQGVEYDVDDIVTHDASHIDD